jgi:CheY-like chemotaxis protein
MATILVVDDHRATRELLRALFQYKGHSVALAENAPDAIVAAEREQPDLIVADVVMPGMDGYTFIRLLREHTRCKTVPVILMSASLEEGKARELAEQCGAAEYLVKPFEPQWVLQTANRVLASSIRAARPGGAGAA